MKVLLLAACGLVVTCAPALAQGRVSPREEAYGRFMASQLAPAASGAVQEAHDGDGARGIRVDLGDLQVVRLRYPTPEAAQRALAGIVERAPDRSLASARGPVLAELRGDQLLLATGDPVQDPDAAQRVRAAMWGGPLRSSGGTQAVFLGLPDGSFTVATHLIAGPLAERVIDTKRAFEAMLRMEQERGPDRYADPGRVEEHLEGVPPPRSELRRTSPVVGVLRASPGGLSAWVSRDPRWKSRVERHFELNGGHPSRHIPTPAPAETPGAAGVIQGLFGH